MSSLPGGYGSESTRSSTAQYRRRDHTRQEQSRLLPMLTVGHRTVISSACYPGLSGQDCVGLRLTSAEVPAMDSTCLRFRDRIFDFGLPTTICWPRPHGQSLSPNSSHPEISCQIGKLSSIKEAWPSGPIQASPSRIPKDTSVSYQGWRGAYAKYYSLGSDV